METWNEFRTQLLADDQELADEYEKLGPAFQAIADVIRLRRQKGISQDQLAHRMGKQQPAIARLEAGRVSPSIAFLEEVAEALDARLVIRIEPLDQARTG